MKPHAPHTCHTVVVVDDEVSFLEILRDILTRAGLQVLTAQNAAEAFAILEKQVPCLVLADVTMPDVNGLEVCRRIKQDPRTAHVPVVLVSGRTEEADVDEGIAAGAADYIKKPFDRGELRMRVRTQIRLHEAGIDQQRLNKHLAVISAAAKDAIVISDDTGAISHWNQAAETMFGYTRDEAMGSNLHELLTPARFRDAQQQAFPCFQATGEGTAVGQTLELVAMRKSGDEFPVELSLSAAQVDGAWCAVGIVRDISERQRMEQELRQGEEQHRMMFTASRDALMTLSPPSWRFTTCNTAAVELFAAAGVAEFCTRGPGDVSPECQPDGRRSAEVAGAMIQKALREGAAHFEWTHQRVDGTAFPADVLLTRMEHENQPFLQATVRDISERKRMEQAATENGEFLRAVLNAIPLPVFSKDVEGRYIGVNPAFEQFFRLPEGTLIGKTVFDLFSPEHAALHQAKDLELMRHPGSQVYDAQVTDGLNVTHDVEIHKATFTDGNGHVRGVIGAMRDLTERKRMETELGHARKLEAVGQLAAGIAHEINTPTQYVGDSVHFLQEAFAGLTHVLNQYRRVVDMVRDAGGHEALIREIGEQEAEVDLDYLESNVPDSLARCLDGIGRISTIVLAMKEFAHPDQREKTPSDLNHALRSTLVIASNEYKYVADIDTDFGELPPVLCYVGDLNQVFLNLIVNAAHAIGDASAETGARGRIAVTTRRDGEWVRIAIADTGSGIPESIRHRIFEPFFTTKEVGKGSGQGLAIARSIVVNKHHGTLTFDSQLGTGTTFMIRLPIDGSEHRRAEESP